MNTFNENLTFEQKNKDMFNKIYRKLGFDIISRIDNKFYDAKLRYKTYIFTVEEKARREVWDDICVEILQDTNTNSAGWIDYSKADFLIYGMFGEQIYIYRLPLKDFRSWFKQNEDRFESKISKKGWGITENKIVPIKDIPTNLIKLIYQK